jgi:hypothetical protein
MRQQRRDHEIKVRKAVLHYFKHSRLALRARERLIGENPCGRERIELRQAP